MVGVIGLLVIANTPLTSADSVPCYEGQTCYSTKAEAVAAVPEHVEPKDCFVWDDGPAGHPWRPIPGTGCAHWVAHQLNIKQGTATCYAGYPLRVDDVVEGREKVDLEDCKIGDIWTTNPLFWLWNKHCGIVRQVETDRVYVEHDSSGQGGVVTDWFSSGKCWTLEEITLKADARVGKTADEKQKEITVKVGDTIYFDGETHSTGAITKYEWDFNGDGTYDWSSTTTGKTTQQYTETGTYTAKLRITNDKGETDTDTAIIHVVEEIEPSFLSDICPAPPNDYLMRMVCLVVPILCVIMNILVPIMFVLIALGGLMQLSTDEGIKNQGKQVILNTILGVIIISAFIGLSDLLIEEINIMEVCLLGEIPPPPLTASIDANPTSGPPPLVVSLTGSASGGTEPYTYSWDCGGGTLEVTGPNTATCTYTSEGTYTITLTVTDAEGETATATQTINVGVEGACEDPSCDQIYGYIDGAITGLVDDSLVRAVIKTESDYHQCCFDPFIGVTCEDGEVLNSSAGALGLMQVRLIAASDVGAGLDDLLDAQRNVETGVEYLNKQLTDFGTRELALAAYNCGPGNIRALQAAYPPGTWAAIEGHLGDECVGDGSVTQSYVNGIMGIIGTDEANCSKTGDGDVTGDFEMEFVSLNEGSGAS